MDDELGDAGRGINLFHILWYSPSSYLHGRTEEKYDKPQLKQVVGTI
jgi:hypothetical protein